MNINELKLEIQKYKDTDYTDPGKNDLVYIRDIINESNEIAIEINHSNDILFIAMEEIFEFLDAVKNVKENNYPIDMDNIYLINFAEEFTDVRIATVKVMNYICQKHRLECQLNYSYLKHEDNYPTVYGEFGRFKEIYYDLMKMHSAISKYARMNSYTCESDQIEIISKLLDSCISVYMKMTSVGATFNPNLMHLANVITDIKIARQHNRDTKLRNMIKNCIITEVDK